MLKAGRLSGCWLMRSRVKPKLGKFRNFCSTILSVLSCSPTPSICKLSSVLERTRYGILHITRYQKGSLSAQMISVMIKFKRSMSRLRVGRFELRDSAKTPTTRKHSNRKLHGASTHAIAHAKKTVLEVMGL